MSTSDNQGITFGGALFVVFLILLTNTVQFFYMEEFSKFIPETKTIIIHDEVKQKPDIHKTINKTINHKTVVNKLSCDKKCRKIMSKLSTEVIKQHIHDDH